MERVAPKVRLGTA